MGRVASHRMKLLSRFTSRSLLFLLLLLELLVPSPHVGEAFSLDGTHKNKLHLPSLPFLPRRRNALFSRFNGAPDSQFSAENSTNENSYDKLRTESLESLLARLERGKKPTANVRLWTPKFRLITGLSIMSMSLYGFGMANRIQRKLDDQEMFEPPTIVKERKRSWESPHTLVQQSEAALRLKPDAIVQSVTQVENPRKHGGWVTDTAGILSNSAKAELNELSEVVRQKTRGEIAVVTLQQVKGCTPKEFATELFNYWSVGDASLNNGVLVLVVTGNRRVEVEIGRGLNRPFNEHRWLQNLIDVEMTPRFKRLDFDGGIVECVKTVAKKLGDLYEEGYEVSFDRIMRQRYADRKNLALGAGATALVTGSLIALESEKSKPVCRRCNRRMRCANGAWTAEESIIEARIADRMLSTEERLERALGSCSYDIYSCSNPRCIIHRADETRDKGYGEVDEAKLQHLVERSDTVGLRRLVIRNSPYSKCRKCSRQTVKTKTSIFRRATTKSTGLMLRVGDCINCGTKSQDTIVIPKIGTSSSSDGGSSDSGFGGGSSDGGGCGGGW